MTLDEILATWEKDAPIDKSELGDESIKIPDLHRKYLRHYIYERMQLRQLESDFKKKRLEAFEFYTQGPSKESTRDPMLFPARGAIMKNDANNYIDADPEIAKDIMKIELAKAKVDTLEHIIKSINNRSYYIKDAITWIKWQGGAG